MTDKDKIRDIVTDYIKDQDNTKLIGGMTDIITKEVEVEIDDLKQDIQNWELSDNNEGDDNEDNDDN